MLLAHLLLQLHVLGNVEQQVEGDAQQLLLLTGEQLELLVDFIVVVLLLAWIRPIHRSAVRAAGRLRGRGGTAAQTTETIG
uniref:Putative secreted protein n=1 Tax=Anopheles darlingi TaxID=43151 RepID=A0A2M4DHJ5_ANODA